MTASPDVHAPPSPLASPRLTSGRATILLLAAMAAVGQFASNVYTPSLPAVAADLGATLPAAQMTFVVFLATFAIAQLAYGPLADRFGRRPALFGGLALFLLGTLGCALAPSLGWLVAARIVQAAGAAAGLVVSRAATRDSFEGADLARTLAAVTIAFALVPGLTPLLGGIVQTLAGWRTVFWVTLGVGVSVALWAAARLPETLDPCTSRSADGWLRSYLTIARDPVFLGTVASVGLVFGSMSAFFAASPALFIGQLGVAPAEYGLYPPFAVSGFIIGGIVVRRLAGEVPPRRIAAIGLAIMLAAVAIMLLLPMAGIVHKHIFNAAMVGNVTGLGVFLPTAIAMALQRFGARAGTAASLQSFVQMSGGALGALVVGLVQPSLPILAMPAVMLASLTLAALVFALTPRPVATR